MRFVSRIAGAISAVTTVPSLALAATIGGANYAPQYDFHEFYAAVDGKPFQVILAGNPFPDVSSQEVSLKLLPILQANKPRPSLTFTYASPTETPRPYYRLYLISAPANDLGADGVCATGNVRHREAAPGKVYLYAIYCRNDQALSYTTARTDASGPADPAIGQLFKELFAVVFSEGAAVHRSNKTRFR